MSKILTHEVLASEFLNFVRSLQRSGTLTKRITKDPASQQKLEFNLGVRSTRMLLTKVETTPYKKPSDFDKGHKEAR